MNLSLHATMMLVFENIFLSVVIYYWQKDYARSLLRCIIGAALTVAALMPLYVAFDKMIFGQYFAIRFVYRTIIYIAAIFFEYNLSLDHCIYAGWFITLIYTSQSITSTTLLYSLIDKLIPESITGAVEEILFAFLECLLEFVVLFIIVKLSPNNSTRPIKQKEVLILIIISVIVIYLKQSIRTISSTFGKQFLELRSLSVVLQMLLIILLVYIMRFIDQQNTAIEKEMQETVNEYRLKNLEQRLQNNEDLRGLRHDMAHHIKAIQHMAEQRDYEGVQNYTKQLLAQADPVELQIDTGNPVINGLLAEKIVEAQKYNIEISAVLNLSSIILPDDFTLCTLFGNALDNALTACKGVGEDLARRIMIKSSTIAGYNAISIENSYCGKLTFKDGIPLTTKKNRFEHGIGILNMKKAAEKCGGRISIDTSIPGRFILTIMLPAKQDNESCNRLALNMTNKYNDL